MLRYVGVLLTLDGRGKVLALMQIQVIIEYGIQLRASMLIGVEIPGLWIQRSHRL